MAKAIVVRSYANVKAYERDANKLARQGYRPTQSTQTRGHLGTPHKNINILIGILTGGIGLLFARTPDHITVTYTHI